jgi:hypothetical protein
MPNRTHEECGHLASLALESKQCPNASGRRLQLIPRGTSGAGTLRRPSCRNVRNPALAAPCDGRFLALGLGI